ncbi:hypothetical protein BOO25_18600 [Vibrio navarrensis]|uniref:hypothetical protein n=1 Tax=Vibrio navarrensis TaxID=29495 RepID=UPI00192F9B17|nr:hypothetical protein [Vibrio navarrensis]MBE3670940.1 hypothetical protein [Vibrio navarrensis]
MSWANCGQDKSGRFIGYAIEAICDHPGCNKEINRGLSYVCGTMHGEDEISCDKYFCEEHKSNYVTFDDGRGAHICDECAKQLLESEEYVVDEDEGDITRVAD